MKCVTLALLLSLLGTCTLKAQDGKQPLRSELAKQERSMGYALVDDWGGVYVVSPEDRGGRRAKAKDPEKLKSTECASPEGRYSVFYNNAVWLRDNQSGQVQELGEGKFSTQCYSPDGRFVYSSGKTIKVYDVTKKTSMDVGEGEEYPTWSPDGKWLGFGHDKHYVLLNLSTGTRRKLFRTDWATAYWSPDSRYLTYTKLGGSSGGFLFWGIKCIEPYRVWVWRVQDGAHDWVQQICKPGRTFMWVRTSDLLFDSPSGSD